MESQRVRALRGPNLWSRHTAIEAVIFCDEAERSIQGLIDFEIQLRTLFPKLHFANVAPIRNEISMAHVIEHVVLGLQAQAGCPVTFSRTVKTNQLGLYQVIVEYSEEAVGRLALDLAWKLVFAARENQTFDLQNALR